MRKFISYSAAILLLVSYTAFANLTILTDTDFGDGNTTATIMNQDWITKVSKENCRATIRNIPFGIKVDENNNFQPVLQANGAVTFLPSTNSDPNIIIDSEAELKKLVAPCRCLEMFSDLRMPEQVFSSALASSTTDAERTAAIQDKKERMQKKLWLERYILGTQNLCQHINFKITQAPAPQAQPAPAAQQAPAAQAPAPAPMQINYCLYLQSNLAPFDPNASNIKTLRSLITLDQNKNCQIDSRRETCNMNLAAAQEKCKANPQADITKNLTPVPDGPARELGISTNCSNLPYFGCLRANLPEYLDIEPGYTAESLDVNKVLKTDGQIGFQGIDDQGAGENNPAINFLLYIINTLSNLSFLIAVFFLIMGGFYTVVASGNSEATDKGKAAIKNFIFAITFTLLSYTIVIIIRTLLYS